MRASPLIALMFLAAPLAAADGVTAPEPTPLETLFRPAEEINLNDFLWLQRVIVVFADSDVDPRYRQQIELLTARADDLIERDVVVITDTDPEAQSPVRLKLRPRGFMLALLGKDGSTYLRKPFPWDVRELSRSIDKMPLRRQEIRDRRDLRAD